MTDRANLDHIGSPLLPAHLGHLLKAQFLVGYFRSNGHCRAIVPADPQAHIVRGRDQLAIRGSNRGHVARCTCWSCRIVFAEHPFRALEIQVIHVGGKAGAMLRFFVDLLLGVVRSQVTLAAVLGAACLGSGEGMALVAGAACTDTPVGIELAHPGVGPSGRFERAIRVDFDYRTMTLPAPTDRQGGTTIERPVPFNDIREEVVEGA